MFLIKHPIYNDWSIGMRVYVNCVCRLSRFFLWKINLKKHFERSASCIIEVRSIARQADHRVIGLTDWEWDGLFYHFKRTRGAAYYS